MDCQHASSLITNQDKSDFDPRERRKKPNTSIHFAMPRSAGGTLGAKVTAILTANNLYKRAKPEEREHLIAEAIQRAIVDGANGFRSVSIEREVMHVKGTNQIKKFTS